MLYADFPPENCSLSFSEILEGYHHCDCEKCSVSCLVSTLRDRPQLCGKHLLSLDTSFQSVDGIRRLGWIRPDNQCIGCSPDKEPEVSEDSVFRSRRRGSMRWHHLVSIVLGSLSTAL